jgi:conjugative transfer signal peptidase TraF
MKIPRIKVSPKAAFYINLGIIVFTLSFMGAFVIAYDLGYRINRTNSLPRGIYRVIDKQPERGDIVSFWPDGSEPFRIARERHYIIPGRYLNRGDGGYDALMKKLMALPGDVVSVTDDGVFVNGELIPNSKPFERDNLGDPLPVFRLHDYTLRENEVLFISDHLPRSYDARYFGVQDKKQILDVLTPVYTW